MVISQYGIVATSQTLASQAGARVLERGGSAIDAAIAANAALGTVEPMSSGIGGDLFLIYREAKTGKLTGINASGWAPKGLSIEALKARGISATAPGGHAVRDRAGMRGRLGKAAQALWPAPLGGIISAGDSSGGERISGHRDYRVGLADQRPETGCGCQRARDLPAWRAGAQSGGGLPQSQAGQGAEADCGRRREGVLQRSYRAGAAQDFAAVRRDLGRRGPGRIPGRMGGAGFHHISRLEGLRAAAQRPGDRRAGDVEHPADVSSGRMGAARV